MMVKRSNVFILDVIYLVCLILNSIISFTMFSNDILSFPFWINLAASYVAMTTLWIYARHVMQNMDRFKRFVPGYTAIGIVLIIYLGCVIFYALFVGFADYALRWFVLLHVITAALAFILCAILMIYIRSGSEHEANEQLNINDWKSIENAMYQLLNMMDRHPMLNVEKDRKSVEAIIELVKYSDPIAPAAVQYNDRQILIDIELLREELSTQYEAGEVVNSERVAMQLSRLMSRLKERNQQILSLKS
nr:hypothetical protein [Paenibacillus xylanexedens]